MGAKGINMAKDFIGKWKIGDTVTGYEDDQQQTEGKMILE
jgi:hypothetical protein